MDLSLKNSYFGGNHHPEILAAMIRGDHYYIILFIVYTDCGLPSVDTEKMLVSFSPTIVVNTVTFASELQLTALSPNGGIMFMTSTELDEAETSILH